MDFPYAIAFPNDCPHVTPLDQTSLGSVVGTIGAAASATIPVNGLAYYIPFRLTRTMVAVNAFVMNGATLATTNMIDIGIYSADGIRLVRTGTTAMASTPANAIQTIPLASTTIGPGLFYIAISATVTTTTWFRSALSAQLCKVVGMATQSTCSPLPTVATFATASAAVVPMFGITCRSFA